MSIPLDPQTFQEEQASAEGATSLVGLFLLSVSLLLAFSGGLCIGYMLWHRDLPTIPEASPEYQAGDLPDRYTVQPGDTLYSIAQQLYGVGADWRMIEAANPGVNPTRLSVGYSLVIPRRR